MKYPKVWGNRANLAAQAEGEAKIRQLQKPGTGHLRASGVSGFSSEKSGKNPQVFLDDPSGGLFISTPSSYEAKDGFSKPGGRVVRQWEWTKLPPPPKHLPSHPKTQPGAVTWFSEKVRHKGVPIALAWRGPQRYGRWNGILSRTTPTPQYDIYALLGGSEQTFAPNRTFGAGVATVTRSNSLWVNGCEHHIFYGGEPVQVWGAALRKEEVGVTLFVVSKNEVYRVGLKSAAGLCRKRKEPPPIEVESVGAVPVLEGELVSLLNGAYFNASATQFLYVADVLIDETWMGFGTGIVQVNPDTLEFSVSEMTTVTARETVGALDAPSSTNGFSPFRSYPNEGSYSATVDKDDLYEQDVDSLLAADYKGDALVFVRGREISLRKTKDTGVISATRTEIDAPGPTEYQQTGYCVYESVEVWSKELTVTHSQHGVLLTDYVEITLTSSGNYTCDEVGTFPFSWVGANRREFFEGGTAYRPTHGLLTGDLRADTLVVAVHNSFFDVGVKRGSTESTTYRGEGSLTEHYAGEYQWRPKVPCRFVGFAHGKQVFDSGTKYMFWHESNSETSIRAGMELDLPLEGGTPPSFQEGTYAAGTQPQMPYFILSTLVGWENQTMLDLLTANAGPYLRGQLNYLHEGIIVPIAHVAASPDGKLVYVAVRSPRLFDQTGEVEPFVVEKIYKRVLVDGVEEVREYDVPSFAEGEGATLVAGVFFGPV